MKKNKKVLAFVDEFGTPGHSEFGVGVVVCSAGVAGQLDTHITHGRPSGSGEIHANALSTPVLLDILRRVQGHAAANSLVLLCYSATNTTGKTAERIYADTVLEALGLAVNKLKTKANVGVSAQTGLLINNVELIMDRCTVNESSGFRDCMEDRRAAKRGHAKAIEHWAVIDSNVSRLLQLADVVAYCHTLKTEVTAKRLQTECGILFA